MDEKKHQYGAVIIGVLLAALLSAVVGLFNRLDRIEGSIQHSDYLDERFGNIEQRLDKLEVRPSG